MRINPLLSKMLAVAISFAVLPVLTFAQASNAVSSQAAIVPSRITQPINEAQLTLLKGNTHPLARTEFDRGAASPGMTLHRMLLSLKRSPDQESALQQFLVDLQDKSSPNYHQWLTPVSFGQQFGPSDQDMQTVISWLESRGFQVTNVTKGRTTIEFTGTVGQVSDAFHTQIHKYSVQGEEHWANASDPQIPSALAPVVAGVATLHNFVKKPHYQNPGIRLSGTSTGGLRPAINLKANNGTIFHAIGPADFATIYNTPTPINLHPPAKIFNGNGVTIAIMGRTDIHTSDVEEFRAIFGIAAAQGFTGALNVILNGPDPTDLGGGEEFEAVIDTTWSSSVAPNATVDFVVSQTTETTDGVDLSEVFAIDNNLGAVMSESFGLCEKEAGVAEADAESSLAEQAAAQGITFMASTGDAGAEGCDDPNSETVATGPIAVEIPAALPFTVAVGGTMFTQNDAAFWNANNNNTTTFETANSYIPENPWNESCATQAACLASVTAGGGGPGIGAGGGGASTIFPTPPFQTNVTGLSGTKREVPDVAFNSALFHDPAVLCLDDQGTSCANPANFFIFTAAGTSVAAPSFAGIMALVNQATGERQGEAGFVLYKLAAAETFSTCNASGATGPTSTNCVFNDVTSGNNAVPGETGFGNANADFVAGTGYDEASGLGSVNATNLINQWNTVRNLASATTLVSLVAPATHGGSASYSVTVTPKSGGGTPTGDVSLIANIGANGQTGGITLSTVTLVGGAATGTTGALPVGTNYTVFAHYEGDGTFLPSDSATKTVSVAGKENSTTRIDFIAFDPNTFKETDNATTATYGSNVIRINVTGTSSCASNASGASGCPSGNVTLDDGGSPLDGGNFALNTLGFTEDQASVLAPGTHSFTASYAGDTNFVSSTTAAADSITVTQGPTNVMVTSSASSIVSGGVVVLTAVVNTASSGLAPTGTVQFFNGSTAIPGTVVLTPFKPNSFFLQGPATLTATLTTSLSAVPGAGPARTPNLRGPYPLALFTLGGLLCLFLLRRTSANRRRYAYVGLTLAVFMLAGMAACGGGGGGGHAHTDSITAKYGGDTNYTGSTSAPLIISVQ
jgi:hypothetical protein